MDLPENTCPELTEKTAEAIDDEGLYQLFISTQMNNVNLCVHAALQWVGHSIYGKFKFQIFRHVLAYEGESVWPDIVVIIVRKFPHYWVTLRYLIWMWKRLNKE